MKKSEHNLRSNDPAQQSKQNGAISTYLSKNYPERPKKQKVGVREYSHAENLDIVSRYNNGNGETCKAIGISYGVSMRAIERKIDRLLKLGLGKPKQPTTPRRCINCPTIFYSIHPKSIHRRCQACTESLTSSGPSFETMYL